MSEDDVAPAAQEYWFNTATGQVEEGKQSSWTDRMGPYATREEAQKALDTAHRRADAWDREDEEWREGGTGD